MTVEFDQKTWRWVEKPCAGKPRKEDTRIVFDGLERAVSRRPRSLYIVVPKHAPLAQAREKRLYGPARWSECSKWRQENLE